MALGATVYRLSIELSDIDRGKYETLEFRVAQHPSEPAERVVARILGYALLHEERLEFGRGVSDADEPALWTHDLTGQLEHWVDVGAPTAERLHLASKRAARVSVVCHKGKDALTREVSGKRIHAAERIEVLYLEPPLVAALADALARSANWLVVVNDGEISVTVGDDTFSAPLERTPLPV